MNRLHTLEHRSIYLIREAYARHKNCALLWSTGKDSTTLLWIARKAFFGKIPFPVLHIDTTYYSKEVYEFRERYEKEWGINLIIVKNEQAIEKGMGPQHAEKSECCKALQTMTLEISIQKHSWKAFLAGIRGDEHGIIAKGNGLLHNTSGISCSTCEIPASLLDVHQSEIKAEDHVRIHPMMFWTVNDIWLYIKKEKIPVLNLYFAHQGKRYRHIGCEPCCTPVKSTANTIEKIIKEHDKAHTAKNGSMEDSEDAYTIQKLKSLGYM